MVGVKDTMMRAPVEPTGGNFPEAGVTVNSLLLPGKNAAVNGSGLLEPTLHINSLPRADTIFQKQILKWINK